MSEKICEDSTPISKSKMCNGCHTTKKITDFICKNEEYDTCNRCSKRHKNNKQKINLDPISVKKAKLLKTSFRTEATSNISSTNFDDNNLEDSKPFWVEENASQVSNENNRYDNDNDGFIYSIDEIEEQISAIFQNLENDNEPVKFTFEIELNTQLAEYVTCDLESELLNLEEEIHKVYLNHSKETFTGCATVYLSCTQREDRQWQRPEDQPHILVQGKHLVQHPNPNYRKIQFPAKAREWIKTNIKYNLRNPEIYKCLCDEGQIDPQVHTKEQAYLEQPKFIAKGYKIIYYLENNFIRALGFITPLLNHIGIVNINEIVVDSMFKTNQERFELFIITRRHDSPLIVFEKNKVITVNPINNPWTRYKMTAINNSTNEECHNIIHLKNVSVTVEHNVIEERQKNLSKYKKPLVKEIDECQNILQAHSQQRTWKKNGKLAFWLC
ncbi:14409_t:CDS:2 [Cetraspora pellucida]|uniref:14409_t:CDS:1 n=1 Tax=Cetraspora pellucida TaxID=1433469 RepID=A0A9N8VIQ6_9GLOM|nr:14409_t:CDS:2 [Cetraspora pellucida]